MGYPYFSLEDLHRAIFNALERVSLQDCTDEVLLLATVLIYIEEELDLTRKKYLENLLDSSVSLELPSPSQAPFPGSAETGDSIPMYFLLVSLFTGSAYLIYLVGSCFLVPVPPIEDIIAAVNSFSSPVVPPVVPEVIIPEPSSTIVDYLPSYTTVIITTAVVVTLWFCGVPIPFM